MNFDKDAVGFTLKAGVSEKNILVSLEEYKELLVIKGKYEELKAIKQEIYNLYTPSDLRKMYSKKFIYDELHCKPIKFNPKRR